MNLKHKRVLITAGPTWVPIDSVRVISNIATGETGRLLAQRLEEFGAKVTLVMGPVGSCCIDRKIRVIHFRFFNDLRHILKKELRLRKYDFIIHSAAVSDFKPLKFVKGKISSGRPCSLKLKLLPKIIKQIRALNPRAKVVIFKLEAGINQAMLIKRARESLRNYQADFVVANRIFPRYKAFILDNSRIYGKSDSKKALAKRLVEALDQAR